MPGGELEGREDALDDRSIVELFAQLATDARAVASAEVAVVKAQALASIARYQRAAIFFALAGTLALAGTVALMVGMILTLSPQIGPGWATAMVCGATFVVVAILGLIGKASLSSARTR